MLQKIIGQPYAVTVLENVLRSERLAGAYLFVGPESVGKATTARQFAKLLCGAGSEDDPTARAIDAGTFPDVRSIEPPRSGIISIAQLWPRSSHKEHPPENAMLRDLHFEPMAGPRRVFIINGAEGLGRGGADAGNSILKTLEEPPSYVHFILTATSTAGLMPTIVSRCQTVHFGLLSADDIEQALMRDFHVEKAPAHFLAVYCEGRLGRAVSLVKSPSLLAAREDLLDWARDLVSAPVIKSFKLGEELRKIAPKLKAAEDDAAVDSEEKERGAREPLGRSLDLLAAYYRDMLSVRLLGDKTATLVNIDRRVEIAGAAAHYSPKILEEAIALTVRLRQAIERNANAQLALEVLLTHLTSLHEPSQRRAR
jgi:DNA polymerase-3 subunit delta'